MKVALSGRPRTRFLFLADDPCLDFINTEIRSEFGRTDLLQSYSDLLQWLSDAAMLPQRQILQLRRWEDTRDGTSALAEARILRSELRRAAEALSQGKPLPHSTLREINRVLASKSHIEQLIRSKGTIEKRAVLQLKAARDALLPLADGAANLLAGPHLSLIRHCEGTGCILFFLDTTRNHTRRWCSMAGCGNRTKVAEFRKRQSAGRNLNPG